MPDPINALNTDMQSRIASYHTLAEKAVKNGDSPTGVFAALERFFYKLEFLLKHGHLPSSKDVNGNRLPPELQGLKDFLKDSSLKAGDSYVLERNDTERYRFSCQGRRKLTVTKEEFHTSQVYESRFRYINDDGWKSQTIIKKATVNSVLDMLSNSSLELGIELQRLSLSGGAKIPVGINSKDLSQTIKDTASGYRTLAKKAVNNKTHQTGVVVALERFFYKLEFLRKNDYLPSREDVNGSRLPPELQGLKDFLRNVFGEKWDSYALQRNDTQRYRFGWQGNGELYVALEEFHINLRARTPTRAIEWRTLEITENIAVDSVLNILDNNLSDNELVP